MLKSLKIWILILSLIMLNVSCQTGNENVISDKKFIDDLLEDYLLMENELTACSNRLEVYKEVATNCESYIKASRRKYRRATVSIILVVVIVEFLRNTVSGIVKRCKE